MQTIKSIVYKMFAPLMRVLLHNSITGKMLKGTVMKLYYDRSQHLGFLFDRQIEYEGEFSKVVLQNIKAGDLVFEFGSNIGQYSLQISAKIGANGKLVCVEPDSDNFAFLSFNTMKNNCRNVHLLKMAVSDHEGKSIFYKDTVTGGRMGSLFREFSRTHYNGTSEEVEITTLKQLTDQFGIPSFIKVDVEGAEALIFNDQAVISQKTIFLIEVREETRESIFSIFHSLGFSIYLLENKLQKMKKASDIPGFGNLIIKFE
jgi:FkbM family methyltransferase